MNILKLAHSFQSEKSIKDILISSEEYRIKMYPMDFEEYLWAMKDTVTMDTIKSAFIKRKPLGDAIHRKIMKIFRTYMAVSGMPNLTNNLILHGLTPVRN